MPINEYDGPLVCDEADEYRDDGLDDLDTDDCDYPIMVWCGQEVTGDAAVQDYLATCVDCRAEMNRIDKMGPPGYSAGIAELGYDGDG